MTSPPQKEKDLILALQQGGSAERASLKQLYGEHLPRFSRFVQQQQGSEAEAKDLFQEGMLVFYKHIRSGKFRGESRIGTYLFSICKYMWYEKRKKESRRAELLEQQEWEAEAIDPYRPIQAADVQDAVASLMAKLDAPCRELLLASLYQEMPMEEIARQMGLKNAQIARNKKYRCLQKLKALLDSNPSLRTRLRDLS